MSLFSSLNSAKPGTAPAPATGPSNLFGSALSGSTLGSTSGNTSTNTTGGFFGGTTRPAASNLFGASAAAPSTTASAAPAAATSTAGTLGASTTAGASNGNNQTAAGNTSHSAYFQSLLEKNKKRAQEQQSSGRTAPGFSDSNGAGNAVPRLELGLGDLARQVRQLGAGADGVTPQRGQGDTTAHYLLAASGVNPGNTIRDLNSLNASAYGIPNVYGPSAMPTSAPAARASDDPKIQGASGEYDPNTHRYVEQLQQRLTHKMIAESLERTQRDFDAYLQRHVEMDWQAQRRRIFEHFGLASKLPADDGAGAADGNASTGEQGGFGRASRRGGPRASTRSGTKAGNDASTASPAARSVFGPASVRKSVIGTPAVGGGNMQLFGDSVSSSTAGGRAAGGPGAGAASNTVGDPILREDRFLRDKQTKLAGKVQRLNEARLQQQPFALLKEFAAVEGATGSDSPPELLDAYHALEEITGEGTEGSIHARQLASDYLDESTQSARGLQMRKRILESSRRALERQFYVNVTTVVARNVREAQAGGLPTRMQRVRAYIRVRAARKDLGPDEKLITYHKETGDYPWALLFYLIRCGFAKEADAHVQEEQNRVFKDDQALVGLVTHWARGPDRPLRSNVQTRANSAYQALLRSSPDSTLDPYRLAVFKILVRADLSKRRLEGLSQGVEDWIWLQFCLAREVPPAEELAGETFGLEQVQETIREIGQRHFSKSSESGGAGYGTYFYLQILGGMYEEAVAYLYDHAYVSAVHVAIALDYYGLLRIADFSVEQLLTKTTTGLPQISFARMIGYYTRDFRAADVVAATDYLTLICLNADLPGALGKAQAELCREALRELVLESRAFAPLLGDLRADGTRVPGAIARRQPLLALNRAGDGDPAGDHQTYLRTVTLQAASVAETNGRTTDAALLYHLAEDYDSVINLINRTLADQLAVDLGEAPLPLNAKPPSTAHGGPDYVDTDDAKSSMSLAAIDDPVSLARHFVALYDPNALYYEKIRPVNREACGLLLRMSEAKASVEAGRWVEALDTIDALHILPLDAHGSMQRVRSAAQTASSAATPSVLTRLIGPLTLWAMLALARQRQILLEGPSAGDAMQAGSRNQAKSMGTGGGNGGNVVFESETRRELCADLVARAKDLLVFAGLIKLRLGKGVWDAIVHGAAEMGVY